MSEDDENVGRFLQDLIARWNFFFIKAAVLQPHWKFWGYKMCPVAETIANFIRDDIAYELPQYLHNRFWYRIVCKAKCSTDSLKLRSLQ